ncbi:MAG: hypothetical protein NTY68_02255 [Candidatus Micrarchaeota archaeon]|nr:hypothetical protein [Candidatus Micrarchaeota archaeon]
MKIARLAFLSFLILSIAFADDDIDLQTALKDFCTLLYGLVGQLAFVMVLLSSMVFTAGQFFGAETRARMSVWANSMLIGAITGILMVILVPWFLGILISTDFSAADCSFTAK